MTQKVDIHYMDAGVHYVMEENFDGYYTGQSDVILPRILQAQEGLYQSLQSNNANHSASSEPNHGLHNPGKNSVTDNSPESQLVLDEALARSLQELESNLALVSLSGDSATGDVHREISSTAATSTFSSSRTTAQATVEDPIDPDNMTYEDLQSLGEFVGNENRGLSDELISFLPSYVYKTGWFFSRRDKNEECVICCTPYKNRERLMSLPCLHHYHSKCITKWLMINKACPICNAEVFGS